MTEAQAELLELLAAVLREQDGVSHPERRAIDRLTDRVQSERARPVVERTFEGAGK